MRFHYRADYRERILIGELYGASPPVVVDWLRSNWKDPTLSGTGEPPSYGDDDGRKLLENVLVKRRDRTINFALAKHGYSLRAIQTAANNLGAAGLYAAANNPRGGARLSQRDVILRRGKQPLLRALLQNKFLPGNFIESLLKRDGPFADLSDDRLFWIVLAITGNERLNRPYDETYLDGYSEYRYHKPFDAAWGLVKTVPVDLEWASALWSLLDKTQRAASFDGVTQALDRWRVDAPIPKPVQWYKREPAFFVRSLIADRLQADQALLGAEDPALRMSFYRRFQPSGFPKWPDFFEDDGEEFFENVMRNISIWHHPTGRARLSSMAWNVGKANASLDAVNSFRATEKRLQAQYPDWFKKDDPD